MDPVAALIVAHGGAGGAIVESAILVAVLLIAGLAWRASRAEDDDGPDEPG